MTEKKKPTTSKPPAKPAKNLPPKKTEHVKGGRYLEY